MSTTQSFPIPIFIDPDRRQKLSATFPQIEQSFRDYWEQRRVPGLALGIVMDGELVYANGFGIQKVSTTTPVTPDSVFRIASMTKSLTAMSVIKLRDEGKLRLDAPAADYVPELAALHYPTRDSVPITVQQLLTMSGGFPQDDPWADRQMAQSEAQLSEWLHGGLSFSNPPGIVFEYSNYGYAILGRIVTNVAGIPYSAYATQNILQPLGMVSSTFDVHSIPPERLAIGHRLEDGEWIEEIPLEDGSFASLGGLFTTITDFSKYMAFLLSAFPPRDDDDSGIPIRRSSAREMQQIARYSGVGSMRQTPDLPAYVSMGGYGFGLAPNIDSILGYTVSHGGGLPGYGTFYRLVPDCGVGVVAFTNLTYSPVGMRVQDALNTLHRMGALQPRTLPVAPVLLAAQESITQLYEKWDDAKAQTLATETFFMDMPLEKRRAQFEVMRAEFGACQSVADLQPENALRGRWIMHCEQGRIEIFMTLSPTVPPQVQYLVITTAKPLSPKLRRAFVRLLKMIDTWDDLQFRVVFAPQVKRQTTQGQLDALRVQYGKLRMGNVLEGDGKTQARVRVLGERGNLDVRVVIDPKSGKVREVAFTRPRETSFVP